ncbi:MAG: phage protein Gp36 family protein [Planctomycetota bacterium]|nr:phage protein Gp36 family protein [Planctomycetota bacterium]
MALTTIWISLASLYRAVPESVFARATDDVAGTTVDEDLINEFALEVESEFRGMLNNRYSAALVAKTASAAVTRHLSIICAWQVLMRREQHGAYADQYILSMDWVDRVRRGETDICEWTEDSCMAQGRVRFQPLKDIYSGPDDECLEYQGERGAHYDDEWT